MTPAHVHAKAHVFVASLDDALTVTGTDGHHLARVLRVHAGQTVTAADGAGGWRVYEVRDVHGGEIDLRATGEVTCEPGPSPQLAVAFALTKERPEHVVKPLTELGVDRVVPVTMERSVVRWDARKRVAVHDRLRMAVREAGMQSRRARLPAVEPAADVAALLSHPALLVGDIAAEPFLTVAPQLGAPPGGEWCIVVGPEGGFSAEERALLLKASPYPPVSVGFNVLRAETAATGMAAVVAAFRDSLS